MDDNQPDEALLQKTYEVRDEVWQHLGNLDNDVLAHLINPSLAGEPDWPDLRRAYKVIHLENSHTIIATDGLSDPFMKNHHFYDASKNGFGMELYIEITEPFSMGSAGGSWWFNVLSQMALQVAYNGNVLDMIKSNGGLISTELHNVPLPQEHTFEGRAPVLVGIASKTVPEQVEGPLSPIHFVSVTLIKPDELDYVVKMQGQGRQFIADEINKQVGGPISSLDRKSVVPIEDTAPSASSQAKVDNSGRKIDLTIKQSWLEKSSETALEEFKSVFSDILNSFPEDRHTDKRWSVSKISEGDEAHLIYDERSIATLKFENSALHFQTVEGGAPRYDDILYAIRYAANRLLLAVYSNVHGGARLPQDYTLSLDQTYFQRDKSILEFFSKSRFTPRYAPEGIEEIGDGRQVLVIYSPYYAENKEDGTIHILNNPMLNFLAEKDDQRTNKEFSYKVADSMNDFARKYDSGLVPSSFYQNYGFSTKIINTTYFDAFHIDRKVFIDPYVWDYDDQHDYRYYKNVKNGMHLMDKVRKGENLDTAVKRLLREELQVADDYVGARIWGLEFDRDKEGILTPRLKMNVYVHGMVEKHKSQSHDWVSIK